jgi:hypothetical protein
VSGAAGTSDNDSKATLGCMLGVVPHDIWGPVGGDNPDFMSDIELSQGLNSPLHNREV